MRPKGHVPDKVLANKLWMIAMMTIIIIIITCFSGIFNESAFSYHVSFWSPFSAVVRMNWFTLTSLFWDKQSTKNLSLFDLLSQRTCYEHKVKFRDIKVILNFWYGLNHCHFSIKKTLSGRTNFTVSGGRIDFHSNRRKAWNDHAGMI
jgi:hypothetical protein